MQSVGAMQEPIKSEETLPFIEYTPEAALRHPRRIFTAMFRDLAASRELAWRLTVRDISAQYRQTALGYLWAVLPPLVTSLVFIMLNSSQIIKIGDTGIPYPAFVIMGTVFWQLFVDSLNAPLKLVASAKIMLAKVNFPREALIISGILQALIRFGIQLVLLAAALVIFRVPVAWTILLVPIPLLGLIGLGTMLGVLAVPFGVLYEDFQHALVVVIPTLMLLTPVVYPPPQAGMLATVMSINPVGLLLVSERELILYGMPQNLLTIAVIFGIIGLFLLLGWVMYRVAIPILVERMGA